MEGTGQVESNIQHLARARNLAGSQTDPYPSRAGGWEDGYIIRHKKKKKTGRTDVKEGKKGGGGKSSILCMLCWRPMGSKSRGTPRKGCLVYKGTKSTTRKKINQKGKW